MSNEDTTSSDDSVPAGRIEGTGSESGRHDDVGDVGDLRPHPRPDQIADIAFFINNPRAGLLHDPGVGKTVTAAVFTEYRWQTFHEKAVWIQPSSIIDKNREEILRFTSFEPEDVVSVTAASAAKKQAQMTGPGKVFLMTAQMFSRDWQVLLGAHPDIKVMFCDEIHLYYAGHTSKRTQSWYIACRHFNAIIPMSGTLIKGRLNSAYPMLHVIAPLYYGSYEAFMAQHGIFDEFGKVVGWQNHEKLRNVLGAVSIRRSFESVYGNQHPVIQVELCDMTPKIRAKYDEFESLGIIELEDRFLDGTTGAMTIRCRQIMAHPETMGLMKPEEYTGKDEMLMIHVDDHVETDERLVIFAALIPEQERIYEHLKRKGLKVAIINGLVSGARRQEIDRDFRAGKIQFIVGSAVTMGVGFNWPFLRMIVFVSLDYGDDTFTQSYKRAIRGIRENALLVKVLEYRNSIDQRIFRIIEGKAKDYAQVDETKPEIFLRAEKELKKARSGNFTMGDS